MSEVKWNIIYPCYLNSLYTREKGRRVSKENSVQNPSAEEIITVLTETGIPAKFEPK
jgi:signal recognition particle subunit SEC65